MKKRKSSLWLVGTHKYGGKLRFILSEPTEKVRIKWTVQPKRAKQYRYCNLAYALMRFAVDGVIAYRIKPTTQRPVPHQNLGIYAGRFY